MVFIYHSGRRLVKSGQKIVFEREATIFIPTFCDPFVFWSEIEKNIHNCPASPEVLRKTSVIEGLLKKVKSQIANNKSLKN